MNLKIMETNRTENIEGHIHETVFHVLLKIHNDVVKECQDVSKVLIDENNAEAKI